MGELGGRAFRGKKLEKPNLLTDVIVSHVALQRVQRAKPKITTGCNTFKIQQLDCGSCSKGFYQVYDLAGAGGWQQLVWFVRVFAGGSLLALGLFVGQKG